MKSDKSDKSGSTSHKRGPSESSEEKSRRNLHTKADPLIAMNELQPSMFTTLLARSHFLAPRTSHLAFPMSHFTSTDTTIVAVALQKSNLGSLRELEFKDQYGNVISPYHWQSFLPGTVS